MDLNIPKRPDSTPRIVIVGGGFAGLELAKKVIKLGAQVVLLDRHNYHTFQPLLYQVAIGGLEPNLVAYPIRKIFRGSLIFRMAEVKKIVPEKKLIETNLGHVDYDYLVLALGAKVNYLGMPDMEHWGMPINYLDASLNLRSLILQNLESGVLKKDLSERNPYFSFVIVGGGPTGVEVSGMLSEFRDRVLPTDFSEIAPSEIRICLIEAGPKLLPYMSEKSSQVTLKYLQDMNVEVRLFTRVKSYDGERVVVNGPMGEAIIPAKTLIWAAGVKGSLVPGLDQAQIVSGNRIKVDSYGRVVGYDDIFAIGDIAAMVTSQTPKGHPQLAPVAMQQGRHLALNFKRLLAGQKLVPFEYKDKGTMATIGRNKAVAETGRFKLSGLVAWLMWVMVHIFYLIGFRNKAGVMFNWIWSYLRFDRSIRLIVRPFHHEQISVYKEVVKRKDHFPV